jgi:DNA-binding beta-propeller fold protein YncE
VYALDRAADQVLFVSLTEWRVIERLYVGKRPSSFDIDASGNFLYVGNEGVGTGLAGSLQIAEVDLETRKKTRQFILDPTAAYSIPIRAENVTAGREGIVYFNSGYNMLNGGYAGVLNTVTGTDMGGLPAIKSPMVVNSKKTKLYGQYIYEGNLGEMGVWNLGVTPPTLVDRFPYSPYPYGWDYNNYVLSGDDKKLVLGYVLFNSAKLVDQLGLFPEMIYALNFDGSVAFGSNSVWDTSTFPVNGDPTRLQDMPVKTDLMYFDSHEGVLYAANQTNKTIHVVELCTSNGIPHRWLQKYSLPVEDSVEASDPDGDGFTVMDEWRLGEAPDAVTRPFRLEIASSKWLRFSSGSPERVYAIEGFDGSTPIQWRRLAEFRGNGTNTMFDMSTNSAIAYRVVIEQPK